MSDTPPPMMPMSQKLVFKKVQKSTLNQFILIQCFPVTKIFFDLSKERFLKIRNEIVMLLWCFKETTTVFVVLILFGITTAQEPNYLHH